MDNLNGKISTILISIFGIFAVAIIANPSILGQLGLPAQYTTIVVGIILIGYNAYFPRNPTPTEPVISPDFNKEPPIEPELPDEPEDGA